MQSIPSAVFRIANIDALPPAIVYPHKEGLYRAIEKWPESVVQSVAVRAKSCREHYAIVAATCIHHKGVSNAAACVARGPEISALAGNRNATGGVTGVPLVAVVPLAATAYR
jgi:hypothetical protein